MLQVYQGLAVYSVPRFPASPADSRRLPPTPADSLAFSASPFRHVQGRTTQVVSWLTSNGVNNLTPHRRLNC